VGGSSGDVTVAAAAVVSKHEYWTATAYTAAAVVMLQ